MQKVFTHSYQWRFQYIELYIDDCFSFGLKNLRNNKVYSCDCVRVNIHECVKVLNTREVERYIILVVFVCLSVTLFVFHGTITFESLDVGC